MNITVKNAFKSGAALLIAAISAVLILATVNALLPKHVPQLDLSTVGILNTLVPTGESDATALADGYFVFGMDADTLAAWNKANGTAAKSVLAVYQAEKGEHAGTVIVHTATKGWASTPLQLYIAIGSDGKFIEIYVAEFSETFYAASDITAINAAIKGKTAEELSVSTFKGAMANSGATLTSTAFSEAVRLAAAMFGEVSA